MPAKQIMEEFYKKTLHSGSKNGPKVTSLAQAKAIAASYGPKGDKKKDKDEE
jgi:hypothetical protein